MLISVAHNYVRNNEIQFAGQLQPKGCCYRLEVPSGQSEVCLMHNGYLFVCLLLVKLNLFVIVTNLSVV
jgi:hypothetical protein